MRLWKVRNGYTGYSDTHVLIIAATEQDALASAGAVFKADHDARIAWLGERAGYESNYWTDLEAELLCDDVSQAWTSKVTS